jgi:TonB-dependent SusC/RagA subfamily outer membrane receptor
MSGLFSLGSISLRPHLFGTLSLMLVAGCATSGSSAGEGAASDPVDIGYGSVDRDQINGSVATVDGREETDHHPRTLAEMLMRVPGVQVAQRGGSMTVRIRGTSSFMASQEPLFVVDGVKMPSTTSVLQHINPNHIDVITVLKDAGQTAVFGSRGANGVILITMRTASR